LTGASSIGFMPITRGKVGGTDEVSALCGCE
jgi:hypothetical protein